MKYVFLCVLFLGFTAGAMNVQGLSHDPEGTNQLLAVGVSHGLPGIDIDVDNVIKMASHQSANFQIEKLEESNGTTSKVLAALEKRARMTAMDGTLYFYFSGHGSPGSIYLQDTSLGIEKMRAAMQKGRNGLGPMARLVFMLDSCYSGSNIDPLNLGLLPGSEKFNQLWVDDVVAKLTPNTWEQGSDYWKEIFVLMSSRADETSNAGENGSEFTVALKKAWDESLTEKLTLKELVARAKKYTNGHHPVEKFDPIDLANEKVAP